MPALRYDQVSGVDTSVAAPYMQLASQLGRDAGRALADAGKGISNLLQNVDTNRLYRDAAAAYNPNDVQSYNNFLKQAALSDNYTSVSPEVWRNMGTTQRTLLNGQLNLENLALAKRQIDSYQNNLNAAINSGDINKSVDATQALRDAVNTLKLRSDAPIYHDVDALRNAAARRALQRAQAGLQGAQANATRSATKRAEVQDQSNYFSQIVQNHINAGLAGINPNSPIYNTRRQELTEEGINIASRVFPAGSEVYARGLNSLLAVSPFTSTLISSDDINNQSPSINPSTAPVIDAYGNFSIPVQAPNANPAENGLGNGLTQLGISTGLIPEPVREQPTQNQEVNRNTPAVRQGDYSPISIPINTPQESNTLERLLNSSSSSSQTKTYNSSLVAGDTGGISTRDYGNLGISRRNDDVLGIIETDPNAYKAYSDAYNRALANGASTQEAYTQAENTVRAILASQSGTQTDNSANAAPMESYSQALRRALNSIEPVSNTPSSDVSPEIANYIARVANGITPNTPRPLYNGLFESYRRLSDPANSYNSRVNNNSSSSSNSNYINNSSSSSNIPAVNNSTSTTTPTEPGIVSLVEGNRRSATADIDNVLRASPQEFYMAGSNVLANSVKDLSSTNSTIMSQIGDSLNMSPNTNTELLIRSAIGGLNPENLATLNQALQLNSGNITKEAFTADLVDAIYNRYSAPVYDDNGKVVGRESDGVFHHEIEVALHRGMTEYGLNRYTAALCVIGAIDTDWLPFAGITGEYELKDSVVNGNFRAARSLMSNRSQIRESARRALYLSDVTNQINANLNQIAQLEQPLNELINKQQLVGYEGLSRYEQNLARSYLDAYLRLKNDFRSLITDYRNNLNQQ